MTGKLGGAAIRTDSPHDSHLKMVRRCGELFEECKGGGVTPWTSRPDPPPPLRSFWSTGNLSSGVGPLEGPSVRISSSAR